MKDFQGEAISTQTVPFNPAVVPDVTSLPPTKVESTEYVIPTLPVSELIDNPPFPFGFPTWIPERFTLDETVGIATSGNWVSFVWSSYNRSEIELLIERDYTGLMISAGENSSEEIEINGKPALLIHGCWDAQHPWDSKRGVSLDWEKDGHRYHLGYSEQGPLHNEIIPIQGDVDKITEELIKIAESVP